MRVYNRHTHQNDTHDIKVYYSMYHYDSEEEVTVPLRFVNGLTSSAVRLGDLDWKLCSKMAADWLMNFLIFESMIFPMKFSIRLSSLHARFESDLNFLKLKTSFQTTNIPKIPDMSSSFHAKMEITDRIGHKGVWNEIYDFNIHYDRELRHGFFVCYQIKINDFKLYRYGILKSKISLSTYFFSAKGTANPFGETDLKQVFDFDSQERTSTTVFYNLNCKKIFQGRILRISISKSRKAGFHNRSSSW